VKHLQSIIGILVLALSCGRGPSDVVRECGGVAFVPMPARQMPSMLSPRSAHGLCELDGEWTVFGGHTSGFVREGSAEYYARGKWHRMEMLYAHDTPFLLATGTAEALLGGGYAEDFGIGQSWGVEQYDARVHGFTALPILERKRAHASAALLGDGTVVVSGNWYAPDATETLGTGPEASVSEQRSYPYILPYGRGQVLIFGSMGAWGDSLSFRVDRRDGSFFKEPLLERWHPLYGFERNVPPRFLEMAPDTYCIPAVSDSGEVAVLQVKGEAFSLLETAVPLPVEGPWGRLRYTGSLWVCRSGSTALLTATDEARRFYCIRLDLSATPAGVDCSVAGPLKELPVFPRDLLLDNGLLLVAGGANPTNYTPSAAVFLFDPLDAGLPSEWRAGLWVPVLLSIAALLVVLGLFLRGKRRRASAAPVPPAGTGQDLSARIAALIEERQLFRNPDLRLADVARELGTNSTYVSACINGELGGSFPEYVAQLRIRYAQELMRSDPSLPLSSVCTAAGFLSERSFFRTFKLLTGLTPGEWKKKTDTA